MLIARSSRRTSLNGRPAEVAVATAASTSARAMTRSTRSPSSITTCSAMMVPPDRSRLRRIRSESTRSPASRDASRETAPPPSRSVSANAGHSACHAPAARSCSWSIAACRTATCALIPRTAARISIGSTGLCFCGRADDPPRPAPVRSETSPTSVCARSTTSNATFPATPAATPSADATSTTRARAVCHGSVGSERASSAESSCATSRPRSARAAIVPAAPPNCTASRVCATRVSSDRASTMAMSQPAALSPKVVGSACCSSVRAAMMVVRCRSASVAAAAAALSRSARMRSRPRRAISIIAVSRTSWLVAPWCTNGAASCETAARSALTSGITGFALRTAARPSCATSNSSTRH